MECILPSTFQKEDIDSLINGQISLKTKYIQSDSVLFSKRFVQDCTKAFKNDLINYIQKQKQKKQKQYALSFNDEEIKSILNKNYLLDKISLEEFSEIEPQFTSILNQEISALHDQLAKELEANKNAS